jgi:hypothetical protein
VKFESTAYICARHPMLRVSALCGHRLLANWLIRDPGSVLRTFTIPASLLAGKKHLTITFHIVEPSSPALCGESSDARLLGLGLRSLLVQPEPVMRPRETKYPQRP